MSSFQTNTLLLDGRKTSLFRVLDHPRFCILKSKDRITNYNEWDEETSFDGKGILATVMACRVFAFLRKHGVPVAFIERHLVDSFVSRECSMIPIVVAVRSYAAGSYLERHPEFIPGMGKMFHRFDSPQVEFCLKTAGWGLIYNGQRIIIGLNPRLGESNPLMNDLGIGRWSLSSRRKDYSYDIRFHQSQIGLNDATVKGIKAIAQQAYGLLEKAWAELGCRLLDCRFEFGITQSGKLVIADVLCNDSWRLLAPTDDELSPFALGDGQPIAIVQDNYRTACELTEHFSSLNLQ